MDVEKLSLIEEAKQGSQSAFSQLVEPMRGRLIHLCQRFLGSEEMARDATQDTFVRAFEHITDFRGTAEGAFVSWLNTIARTVCLNQVRTKKNEMRKSSLSLDDPSYIHLADQPDTSSEETVEQTIFNAQLLNAITEKATRWDKLDWELFILRIREGKSFEEAAKLLGKPKETLKSRFNAHIRPVLAEVGQQFFDDS